MRIGSSMRSWLWYRHFDITLTGKAGEYIGTTMFLFMGFTAAHIANLPQAAESSPLGIQFLNTANLMFIALAFGISLVINAWIFFRVSGALFNPAISLALALAGVIKPLRAGLFVIAQTLGGMTAAALVNVLTPGKLNVGTRLGGDISIPRGQPLNDSLTQ
jgi:aquaporin rerated protein, other eukaryote